MRRVQAPGQGASGRGREHLAIGAAALRLVAAVIALVSAGISWAAPADARALVDRRPGAGAGGAAVPVLMYHQIAAAPRGRPNASLYVRPARFADHVRALARAGYTAVTLGRVWRSWRTGARLPARPVVLSFDDGYRSQYRHAFPVLATRRWPGVLNLTESYLKKPAGVTAAQVRRMIAARWELGAHTETHPDLRHVDDAALDREVAGSRDAMRRRFGVSADFFCYPYGRFDERVAAAVRDAGFLGATTTRAGLASPGDDPYALDRIKASGDMTGSALVRMLRALRAAER